MRLVSIQASAVLLACLAGCAATPSGFVVLDYEPPAAKAADPENPETKAQLEAVLLPSQLMAATSAVEEVATDARVRVSAPVPEYGSGIDRPEVDPDAPWNIVLKGACVGDTHDWFGTGEVAILLRVTSGDNSTIDGEWILAAYQEDLADGQCLSLNNLVVWSGKTTQEVMIEVKLVDVDSVDKAKRDAFLSATQSLTSFIPTYGPLASQLVALGRTLNDSAPDQEIILQYQAGFYPAESLRYAAYCLIEKDVLFECGNILWYYNFDRVGSVMVGGKRSNPADPLSPIVDARMLLNSWVVFEVNKGTSATFARARFKAQSDVLASLRAWVLNDQAEALKTYRENVKSLGSAAEMAAILGGVNFKNAGSIGRAMSRIKTGLAMGNDSPFVSRDLEQFGQVLRSYLPAEAGWDGSVKTESDLQTWKGKIDTLANTHRFDPKSYRWVAKATP